MIRSAVLGCLLCGSALAGDTLRVLFLGDQGHHRPHDRYLQMAPVMARRGIAIEYTESVNDLRDDKLASYDALIVYANIDQIGDDQAAALLKYVGNGGGFVPLHCASYCFRNNAEVVALIGAQFHHHGTGTFRTEIVRPNHPIMKGFGGFESWDETYVHHLHNEENREVLSYRREGDQREPWTWVRTHGKGRVFYTAWGHDHRTWGSPGFQNLLERGIRWAAGDDPSQVPAYVAERPFPLPTIQERPTSPPAFRYVDVGAKIPNYTPGARWGTQGAPITKMQLPLPPDESMKRMVVPAGFHVELFASEPQLGGKPIYMDWDEDGRLWVCETVDYPNELHSPGQGRDRIRVCEDTDGDWKADRFTVFAEGLSIPTTLTFYRGGVIVQSGTETLYLKDHDGDLRADERTVLFSGWNMRDTHGGVSNFQYGLDNWIWAMQGYNASRPLVQGKPQQQFSQGFFRFRPDGSELEFIRSTNNNTWGLGITEEGIVFGSTANRNPSVYMPIPNRYYERVRGWAPSLQLGTIADTHLFHPITDRVRQVDQHGGYTAGAGHAIYTARRYPEPFWNRTAFVNGPTGHLVGTFLLKPVGSDFRSTSPFNLLASDDEWTAPIRAEVGPDGNVWVLDWYNYIVQHNPTPQGFRTGKGNAYETDLRDKKHGRIYRVVYGDSPSGYPSRMKLSQANTAELVRVLGHPTMLWRKHAQRLLVERRALDAVPTLLKRLREHSLDDLGLDVAAIHALWTLQGLGVLDGRHPSITEAVKRALRHPSAGVRRNAVQVLPYSAEATRAIVDAELLYDRDAQVRLAAFLALADRPAGEEIGTELVAAISYPPNADDRWIPDAATSAAARHASIFLRSLSQADAARLETVARVAEVVANHLARSEFRDDAARVIRHLVSVEPGIASAVVRGLQKGWPKDATITLAAPAEDAIAELLPRLPAADRPSLVRLARLWGSQRLDRIAKELTRELLRQVDDERASEADRIRAARELIALRPDDADLVAALLERIRPQSSLTIAAGYLQALQQSTAEDTGRLVIARAPHLTPEARAAAIRVMLSRPAWAYQLLGAIDQGVFQLGELALDQRQALVRHPDEKVRRRAEEILRRQGSLPNADRQRVLEELSPLVLKPGDAAAGKQVYLKHCSKCHVHGTEGSRVGPDLTGMAVHPKEELLIHILDPNRSVEGNFRVYTVLTEDGIVLSGLMASESQTSIELYDAEGKRHSILREDIDQLAASPNSLMPVGFEKQLTPDDLRNLLEFLTQRGRYLPIDLTRYATAPSDRGMFYRREAVGERLVFDQWGLKTFRGVPFLIGDPQDGRRPNVILLHGPIGAVTAEMPKSVKVPCHGPATAIHLLSGISGWGFPAIRDKSVSMIVRLHYEDGSTEDHPLRNGVHFADYIRRVDVPGSEFAFDVRGRQIRYLSLAPRRAAPIAEIEFVKGPDRTAPIVVAVTIESAGGARESK